MNRVSVLTSARTLLGDDLDIVGWHAGHLGTAILGASTSAHGEVIVKIHRSRQRHDQEIYAYQHWTPALGDLAPRLVADGDQAIAITAIAGEPIAHAQLTRHQQHEVFRQAGAILHRFHTAGPAQSNPGWYAFLADRGEYWLNLAGPRISPTARHELSGRIQALTSLPATPLTPCHLDFSPRNLIRDEQGIVRVIDFEHARYDLPARDLVRLFGRLFNDRADLREAFLDIYGPLSNLDQKIIECCTAIDYASLTASAGQASDDLRLPNLRLPRPACGVLPEPVPDAGAVIEGQVKHKGRAE